MARGPGKGRIINMKAGVTTETLKRESPRLQLRVARGGYAERDIFSKFQGRSRAVKTLISHRGASRVLLVAKEPVSGRMESAPLGGRVQASPSVGEYSSDCTITAGDLFEVYLRNR